MFFCKWRIRLQKLLTSNLKTIFLMLLIQVIVQIINIKLGLWMLKLFQEVFTLK